MNPHAEALRLHLSGYCPGSNKYRIVSRIDRADWREHMAVEHTKGFSNRTEAEAQGRRWVQGLGDASAASFYRSCVTEDKIEPVCPEVFKELKRLDTTAGGGFGWGCWVDFRPLVVDEPAIPAEQPA